MRSLMIALVDCNNFFASCERLFRPDLKDKPVLVLSNNDGCVVARSEEVRALGIPMGVPYFKIRDIVEHSGVVCFSSNFALYSNISQRILGVLSAHAPHIEVYSIDEAFLDLSQLPLDDAKKWGNNLQQEISSSIGMPVSVGVAPTKTLAKLAAKRAKSMRESCVLDPENKKSSYESILAETPIGSVWGIGWALEPKLRAAGVKTALQFARASEKWVHSMCGINGVRTRNELLGKVQYPFKDIQQPQKSLMVSRSFGHTIKKQHELESAVADFASRAAYKLRSFEQAVNSFGIYIRYRTPDGETKSQTAKQPFPVATNDTSELVSAALQLLNNIYDPDCGYKKAGVFAYNLSSANICQVDLFDVLSPEFRARRKNLMTVIDSINKRYGTDTVHIGSIDPKATRWHAKKQRMSPAYTTNWAALPLVYKIKSK